MKFFSFLFAVVLTIFSLACPQRAAAAQAAPTLNVLASTYPIWLLTRAVTDGVPGVEVRLLVASGTGCPHDYAPTPADLLRIEQADLIIINGLGMEDAFRDALARRGAHVLDCGASLGEALAGYAGKLPAVASCGQGHHDHDHAACEANPHVFAGPRLAARMAGSIAEELARRDAPHAGQYRESAARFAAGMRDLLQRLRQLTPQGVRPRVLLQHDALAYLAADAGFEVLGIVQASSSDAPTASHLMQLLADAREKRPDLLLGEEQFADRTMRMLAQEADIPLLCLDSLASGPEDVPADQYLRVMQNNVSLLEERLAHSPSL